MGDRLRGGWWQLEGAMELAQRFIKRMLSFEDLPQESLRFWGASAGGFFSLAMAGLFPGAKVISDIPQVDLERSPFVHNVEILRAAGVVELKNAFHWWSPSRPPRDVRVFFNSRDVKHIRTQVPIILNNLNDMFYNKSVMLEKFSINSYDNSDATLRDHAPMEKNKMLEILRGT